MEATFSMVIMVSRISSQSKWGCVGFWRRTILSAEFCTRANEIRSNPSGRNIWMVFGTRLEVVLKELLLIWKETRVLAKQDILGLRKMRFGQLSMQLPIIFPGRQTFWDNNYREPRDNCVCESGDWDKSPENGLRRRLFHRNVSEMDRETLKLDISQMILSMRIFSTPMVGFLGARPTFYLKTSLSSRFY